MHLDAPWPLLAVLYRAVRPGPELSRPPSVTRLRPLLAHARTSRVFLSCGRPVLPAAIPGRFSSSSLPPSFAQGRRTTGFIPQGTAGSGAPGAVPGGVL